MNKQELIAEAIKMRLTSPVPEEAEREFTCYGCPSENTCHCAWDLYNLDGDCLADK